MSSPLESRSALLQFLDSFFQERNIKWMLGIGMGILLGSSLMLVTSHWDDYTPFWKFLVMIVYTAGVFAAGEACLWRLGLKKTGTVLLALTVLLLPITFLGLRWLGPPGGYSLAALAGQVGLLALLGLDFAFGLFAARRAFNHFLCMPQRTFLASYLTLCVAGAVVPGLPVLWWPAVAIFLWAVFTAGIVKVNRHVFWLSEEHRLPRIFGFFPIALLGGQFIVLFAVNLVSHIPLQWMGLLCVLVAMPVLLTANAVARVFQQRTGNLVRPWPWSIVLPIIVGLVLTATGICLAMTGWPRPYALVPTAALAAVLMAVTAHRTRNSAFVWAMLGGLLLAYNFSPVFFQEFARAAAQHGATAVHEDRLPFAFYGLTYLPVLAGLMIAGRLAARAGQELFAGPIRRFSIGLALLLLAVSLSHVKAVFPVGLVMTGVFAAQTYAFRDRRLMTGSIAGWITAAAGFTPFVERVFGLSLSREMPFLSFVFAAAVLLFPGRLFDRLSASLSPSTNRKARWTRLAQTPCQGTSLWLTLAMGGVWLVHFGLSGPNASYRLSGALVGLLMLVHALVWLKPGIGGAAVVFGGLYLLIQAHFLGATAAALASAGTCILFGLWVLAVGLTKAPDARISRAFCWPAYGVSLSGLTLLLVLYYLPQLAVATFASGVEVPWIAATVTVVWAFSAARRVPHGLLTWLGCLGVLGLVGSTLAATFGTAAVWEWLPAAWAATALATVPVAAVLRRRLDAKLAGPHASSPDSKEVSALRAMALPVNGFVLILLTSVAPLSLFVFTTPIRIAGGLATLGLLLSGSLRRQGAIWQYALILLNWQLICGVVQVFAPQMGWILGVSWSEYAWAALPVATAAAASLTLFQLLWRQTTPGVVGPREAHCVVLRILIALSLVASLQLLQFGMSLAHGVMALATFTVVVFGELRAAYRDRREARVWLAEMLVVAAIAYFRAFGVFTFGLGLSMILALTVGLVLWSIGQVAARRPDTGVFARPLTLTGMLLPLVSVGIGMVRHVSVPHPEWLGMNSLALLIAAAFYFWRGLEERDKRLSVLSAIILNVSLTLLWREIEWWDPQCFMIPLGISILWLVQLLKNEIPAKMHDPIRYLGALVILVSPTFHIVGGSWIHLLTLMLASVGVVLVAMGLRVRALMYTGTAFLLADLVAMVVRGSVDHPTVLWMAGIAVGAGVIILAAICENHRELLLARMRRLAVQLATWE